MAAAVSFRLESLGYVFILTERAVVAHNHSKLGSVL